MPKLALKGSLASGKTAVAGELVKLGLTLVNFTDLLKQLYAEAHGLTLNDVLMHKELHRQGLIDFGHEIGFDTDPKFVREAVERAGNPEQAVFDNVRYPDQMNALQQMDYRLVRLYVPRELLRLRLQLYKGLSAEEAERRLNDGTELALDGTYYLGEVEMRNYDRTPAETAAAILDYADALDAMPFPRRAAA